MSAPQTSSMNPVIAATDRRKQYRKKGGWIVLLIFSVISLIFWLILFLESLFLTKDSKLAMASSVICALSLVICALSLGLMVFAVIMLAKVAKHNAAVAVEVAKHRAAVVMNHKDDLCNEKTTRQAMQDYQRRQNHSEQSANTKAARFYRESQEHDILSLTDQEDFAAVGEIPHKKEDTKKYHFSEKFVKNLIIVDKMLNDYYDRFIPSYEWQTDYICNKLNEAFEIIDQIIDHIKEDEDANWYYKFWSKPLTISSNDTTYNSYQKIMEHIKILEDSTDVHFLQGIFRIRDIVEENGHQNCKIV